MSKKKDDSEEIEDQKICMNCKHYQKPDGQHIQTTWCANPKSAHNGTYVYKGDSCSVFEGKRAKKKESDEKSN